MLNLVAKLYFLLGKLQFGGTRTGSDGLNLAVSGFGLFRAFKCRARVGPGFTKMSSDGPGFRAFKSPT